MFEVILAIYFEHLTIKDADSLELEKDLPNEIEYCVQIKDIGDSTTLSKPVVEPSSSTTIDTTKN